MFLISSEFKQKYSISIYIGIFKFLIWFLDCKVRGGRDEEIWKWPAEYCGYVTPTLRSNKWFLSEYAMAAPW